MRPSRRIRVTRILLALATALSIALMLRAHARANAAATELLQAAGTHLVAYANATHDDGVRTLYLNGAPLDMRSGSTHDAVNTVLDAYAAQCRARNQRRDARDPLAGFDGIVRFGNDDGGFLGCLDLGAAPITPSELLARVGRFAKLGELAALGELEVVWAMRASSGARYVAVRPAANLAVLKIFRAAGDAPGIDVPGVPRPPHARRLLSIWQIGAAPMIASYASLMPPSKLASEYSRTLRRAGFSVLAARSAHDHGAILHASRSRRGEIRPHEVLIVLGADDPRGSLITVAPLSD